MDLKSWKHFTGKRVQISQQVLQAVEMLCKQLGLYISPCVTPVPGHIEELSEESQAVCQGLEIAQNTEGILILAFK